MDSPCATCEFRTRSKDKCINLNNSCEKILEYQEILNRMNIPMQSSNFDGTYSTPSTGRKGYHHDFD